jgi:hypothetical protein
MRTSTRVVAFEHSQSGHTERLERLRMNKSRGLVCNKHQPHHSTTRGKSLFPHFHFACFWVLGCLAAKSVGHQIQKIKRRPLIRARLFLGFDMTFLHLVLFRLLFLCVPAWDRIMCAVHVTTAYRYSSTA